MLFERFEDSGLSHYSYMIGCQAKGEALIVDPRRDVDVYIDFAEQNEMKIVGILETHIHADFASGARELGQITGAPIYESKHDAGEVFEVQFPHVDIDDGSVIRVGRIRVEALHTPGHTPEHMSFLVYDEPRSEEVPMLLLTGDFLFVGSIGRPDLLGEDAKIALAHQLYGSVQKIRSLPDSLEIHPAHGAGSMCGAGISGRPLSTLGFERIANPYLDPSLDEEAFVAKVLGTVPPFPDYYRRMKQVNSDGAPILDGLPGMIPLGVETVSELDDEGALIVDLRDQAAFGQGHIEGAYGIGAGEAAGSFSKWASWVLPYDTPIVLIAEAGDLATVERAVRGLIRVQLDGVVGYLEGGMQAWLDAGMPRQDLEQIDPGQLEAMLAEGSLQLIDVREVGEYEEGHIEGALNIIAGEMPKRLDEVPNGDRQLAVICGSGYRSTVAASVLQRSGFEKVLNVAGGMKAWQRESRPVVE